MKQIPRGLPGYVDHAKKAELIKTIVMFALVLAILLTGIYTTGNRMNLLTIVAVVGCLPAARYLVNYIARAPFHSMEEAQAEEIEEHAGDVPVYYELILGASDKNRFVDCIAISEHAICGYASHPKTDIPDTEAYLKKICRENGYKKVSVKLFDKKEDFLRRLDEMQEHYDSDEKMQKQERALGHSITLICL